MQESRLIELSVKAALFGKKSNAARNLACAMAREFELKSSETNLFNQLWKLYRTAVEYHDNKKPTNGLNRLGKEVNAALQRARMITAGKRYSIYGHSRVKTLGIKGNYVVFSDHHMGHDGCRQNFFKDSSNDRLYCTVLDEYFNKEFTLIENGDVEELIIDEQSLSTAKKRANMSFGELQKERIKCRARTLERIINDNAWLYSQINESFGKAHRLVRIVGNHDQQLQNNTIHKVFKQAYPHLGKPFDYVLLKSNTAGTAKYVICHGHQFDEVSNPRFAPRLGESFSETLGYVNQGADRQWKWTDGPGDWVSGSPFANNLVTSEPAGWKLPATAKLAGVAAIVAYISAGGIGGSAALALAAAALKSSVKDPDFWESEVLKSNVAWEYFENTNAYKAISKEVAQGNEHFKFRHLDERLICQAWARNRPKGKCPNLVLGHSHEPRYRPAWPLSLIGRSAKNVAEFYYNSGSVGRFQNLLWGIEIRNGKPLLVSWHRPAGPGKGSAERRVHSSRQHPAGVISALFASPSEEPF